MRPLAYILTLVLTATVAAQSTRPADSVVYRRADGTDQVFQPATGPAPVNRDAIEIRVVRPGGAVGVWTPAAPPLPAVDTRRPTGNPRGDGIAVHVSGTRTPAPVTLANIAVDGFRQNIALGGVGTCTFDNVRSVNAFRETPAEVYQGQGLYVDRSGPITIRGSLFGWNGFQSGKPAANKNGFRHGIYQNVTAGPATVEDTIFIDNACAGFQSRNGATFRRCVFIGNAIHLLAVKGEITLEDCTFIGGSYYANTDATGKVKSWTGNSAVYAYTPVTLRRCLIVGTPGQERSPSAERAWVNGALATDKNHRDNPGVSGRITCDNVTVRGWPARTVPGTADITGTVTIGGAPVAIDPMPVVNRYLANEITGPAAVAEIRRMAEDAVR